MANYKTPGVYVEEIVTLGSSVASVPTAVPGFTGYTEKAILPDGTSATSKPVRITSMLEYQQYFGGPFKEPFKATLTGTVPAPTTVAVTVNTAYSKFILYYQMQMFFANGGGACYVVSVGNYSADPTLTPLKNGIDVFEQVDEVTLLVTPETVFLSAADRKTAYDWMTTQCNKLQDRFAILDALKGGANVGADASQFRDNEIGANNLKYAAAYYPSLNTVLDYQYNDAEVVIDDQRTIGTAPFNYKYNTTNNSSLYTVYNGKASFATLTIGTPPVANTNTVTINGVLLTATVDFANNASNAVIAENLKNAINNKSTLSSIVVASIDSTTPNVVIVQSRLMGTVGNYTVAIAGGAPITGSGNMAGGVDNSSDVGLYNSIKASLTGFKVPLYPSAAMAGIYANVDSNRGVWKAPANVSLSLVSTPTVLITSEQQEGLNIDATSGKSINAIRQFAGKGTMVWGARTLAGNDNEWRYVNVRRLFIYVEESIKKATEFVVFEPNTASTWQRVKSMCEAFLTGLWRDGALAGATPKEAFFVRIGLGSTMTADDILNGKMIVEIGMAASRPAEFIILRFSHKIQES